MKKLPLTQKDFAWSKWTPKQMKELAQKGLVLKKQNYQKIKSILPESRTYENTVFALERADTAFGDVMNKLAVLGDISPKKDVRDAAHLIQSKFTSQSVDLDYDRDLYLSLVEYREGNYEYEKKALDKEDIKLLEDTIKEYERLGFNLSNDKQKKFKQLVKKNINMGSQFNKNLVDYQDHILCSEEELDGLSERARAAFAKDTKTGKYIVTLQIPHYSPFMSYATNRKKREELSKKALSAGGKKNLKLINELAKTRHSMAQLLGYKHHADFRTETRMAKTGDTAMNFQISLLNKLAPKVKKESLELLDFAKKNNLPNPQYYDKAFMITKMRKELFDIEQEKIREYFPLPHVQKEMFALFGSLYGIRFKQLDYTIWHKDATVYEVSNTNKSIVGYFVLDLYARPEKSSHAACLFDVVSSHEVSFHGENFTSAVGVILCNFSDPTKKAPSLLSMWEVETLFHEFGHCMHHLLSTARHRSHAGTSVAWDFVETPSQFHENWVWNDTMLQKLSKHYITSKKIPKQDRDNLLRSKLFRSASGNASSLILGIVEMELHMGELANPTKRYLEMVKKYFNEDLPEKHVLFPANFGHIGQFYDAAYYSYLWALVYAQDAFSEFEKKGIFNKELGMRWRKEVLEKGSSEDELKLVKNFLGRKPSDKAFLRELGVK
jgi:thimet oligopeptidase